MSTPHRGAGKADDPVLLDSSDDEVNPLSSSQAGPSRRALRANPSSSSHRASLSLPSEVVDLTQNDARRQSTSPRKSQHSNSSGRSKKSVIMSPRDRNNAIDLSSEDPPIPSAPPGSWGNPMPMQLPLPPSQIRRTKEKEPTPPPGSWGNPIPAALPIPTAVSAQANNAGPSGTSSANRQNQPRGSWGNPEPIVLPPFPASQRKPASPKPKNRAEPLFLPAESPVPAEGTWSGPTDIPIDPVLLEQSPTPAMTKQADHSAEPSDRASRSFTPIFMGYMAQNTPNHTSDPPRGSWGNPEPIDLPLPSHVTQPGTWGNPAPIELPPMPAGKRAPSPTSPNRDDTLAGSRSRKGKARRLDSPEKQDHPSGLSTKEQEAEIKAPPKKLGPRWVTSDSAESSTATAVTTYPGSTVNKIPLAVSAVTGVASSPKRSPKQSTVLAPEVQSTTPEQRKEETKRSNPESVPQLSPDMNPPAVQSSNVLDNALALTDITVDQVQSTVEADASDASSTVQRIPPMTVNVDAVNRDQDTCMDTDPDTSVDISPLIPTRRDHDTVDMPAAIFADALIDERTTWPETMQAVPEIVKSSAVEAISDPPVSSTASQEVPEPDVQISPGTSALTNSEAPEATLAIASRAEVEGALKSTSPPMTTPPVVAETADTTAAVTSRIAGAPEAASLPESPPVPAAEVTTTPMVPIAEDIQSPSAGETADKMPETVGSPSAALSTSSSDVVTALAEPSTSEGEPRVVPVTTSTPPPIAPGDSAPEITSSTTTPPVDAAKPAVEEVDIKPSLPSSATSTHARGMSSLNPIALDDEDLDFLTSDNEDDVTEDVKVEEAVEDVRIGVDEVEIQPAPVEAEISNQRASRQVSISSTPSIQEIKPEGTRQQPEAGPSRRSTRILEKSSDDELTLESPASRVKALDAIRARRRAKQGTPSGSSATPVVEIPTRSKRMWEGVIESEGESDVEDMLDLFLDSPPSSGPSRAVDMVEHQGFTIKSTFDMLMNSIGTSQEDDFDDVLVSPVHSIVSITIPDTPVPPERAGQANRILNTRLIDEWNRRKRSLTNNPPLHRAVFEAYMAQSTSIDEPQADEIRVVNDVDAEGAPPDFEFQYSNDMLYNPDVPDPELGRGCDCEGPCDPDAGTCSCAKRQELYFYDLGMSGFAYDEHGHIKETSVAVWECGKNCGCPPSCMNRVIQRGRGKDTKIELFKTKWKGWGVRARANIPAGTFLGIYAGELITEQESEERGKLYAKLGRTYLFDCDGWQIAHPPPGLVGFDPRAAELAKLASQRARIAAAEANDPSYVYSAYSVDAFHYGFTRYFNHSCDPNLAITQAYVKDFHPERPILVIFARRPVKMNEELCISYKGLPDEDEDLEPVPIRKPLGKGGKHKKNKTSASAHITGVTKTKVAAKDRCMCKTARCDGRMFNYGG
ncbi:hypothetical protein IAU59_000732 [Kwoniella sp. CBS 9459]